VAAEVDTQLADAPVYRAGSRRAGATAAVSSSSCDLGPCGGPGEDAVVRCAASFALARRKHNDTRGSGAELNRVSDRHARRYVEHAQFAIPGNRTGPVFDDGPKSVGL
jgi:hypothetical protein